MKVKCIDKKTYNKDTGEILREDRSLSLGEEYIILSIYVFQHKTLYMLVADHTYGTPGFYESEQFEVVSHKIPKNWKISSENMNFVIVIIGPEAWRRQGFLEDCHDGDIKALEIYKREARIIYEEEENI